MELCIHTKGNGAHFVLDRRQIFYQYMGSMSAQHPEEFQQLFNCSGNFDHEKQRSLEFGPMTTRHSYTDWMIVILCLEAYGFEIRKRLVALTFTGGSATESI